MLTGVDVVVVGTVRFVVVCITVWSGLKEFVVVGPMFTSGLTKGTRSLPYDPGVVVVGRCRLSLELTGMCFSNETNYIRSGIIIQLLEILNRVLI